MNFQQKFFQQLREQCAKYELELLVNERTGDAGSVQIQPKGKLVTLVEFIYHFELGVGQGTNAVAGIAGRFMVNVLYPEAAQRRRTPQGVKYANWGNVLFHDDATVREILDRLVDEALRTKERLEAEAQDEAIAFLAGGR